MSSLLNIEEPSGHKYPPSMTAFLSLGFRPLYIAGASWALISIALWIFTPQLLDGPLPSVYWHAHEMLWGFIITIAAGFLLTASATWTGFNPLKGPLLGLLCVFWLVARWGFLFAGELGFWLATVAESLFFILTAASLARVMVKGHSTRNYGIPIMFLLLGLANVLYLLGIKNGDYTLIMQRFDLGLLGMAIIALLIARRVIPFFSMRMVAGLQIPMLTRLGHVQIAFGLGAIILGISIQLIPGYSGTNGQPLPILSIAMAASLAITGLISFYQLYCWRPRAVLHKPLLWILFLGYACIAIGLIAAAIPVSRLFEPTLWHGIMARSATHVHLIAMAGFGILIIGMLTRTALGHLGRPLALDGSMRVSYWAMIVAVVLRLLALWPSTISQILLHASATAWILCFGLYLWRFVPMLIRPRPDKPWVGKGLGKKGMGMGPGKGMGRGQA